MQKTHKAVNGRIMFLRRHIPTIRQDDPMQAVSIPNLLRALAIPLLLLAATPSWAASFDCKKATTDVEKLICGSPHTLSQMDNKLANIYRMAREEVPDPEALKAQQLAWLKERDRCVENAEVKDAFRCLTKSYDRRIDELLVLAAGHKLWDPPPAMMPAEIEQVYVIQRRETLKSFFEDRPLETVLGKDDPLCADFARDFTAQNEAVELVPPKVVAHDYDDRQLQNAIFDNCPDLELRSHQVGVGPYVGPRNFLLFKVDIDNNPDNGKDFVYLEEVMAIRETSWLYPEEEEPAPRIVAENTFFSINFRNCEYSGSTGTGLSRSYPIDHDVSHEDPQVGLYGLVRYQGKHYLYDVIQTEPKARPLTLIEYTPGGFDNFTMRCGYHSRN